MQLIATPIPEYIPHRHQNAFPDRKAFQFAASQPVTCPCFRLINRAINILINQRFCCPIHSHVVDHATTLLVVVIVSG
jgi:hypothetical protein